MNGKKLTVLFLILVGIILFLSMNVLTIDNNVLVELNSLNQLNIEDIFSILQ